MTPSADPSDGSGDGLAAAVGAARRLARAAAEHDLTSNAAHVLVILAELGDRSTRELAADLVMSGQQLSYATRELRDRGLANTKEDSADSRRRRVSITDTGVELHRSLLRHVDGRSRLPS